MARVRAVEYKPSDLPVGTTLARQVSRQHLTTLNNALWVTEHGHGLLRTSFTSIAMPSGPSKHGCFGTDIQWAAAVDDQRNWVRQHVIVSAAALLETYLGSVITSALYARPDYADRSLAGLREIEYIKNPDKAIHLPKLVKQLRKGMVTGAWESRLRNMAITFGPLPAKFLALGGGLQRLQDKRNRIAHALGGQLNTYRGAPWQPVDVVRPDETEVENTLKLTSFAIREADKLFGPLIGAYEFLREFHSWQNSFVSPFDAPAPPDRARVFKVHIGSQFGTSPSKPFMQALISRYDSVR